VESDALAQVEGELQAVFREGPAFGQGGLELQILIGADQRLVNKLEHAQRSERGLCVGVQAGRVDGAGHDEHVAAVLGHGRRGHADGHGEHGHDHDQTNTFYWEHYPLLCLSKITRNKDH